MSTVHSTVAKASTSAGDRFHILAVDMNVHPTVYAVDMNVHPIV